MSFKKFAVLVVLFGISLLGAAQDDYDKYNAEIKEQYKEENIIYRTFNRYEINPGFSKYSIGPSWSVPTRGWQSVEQNFGVKLHSKHKELGVQFYKGNNNFDEKDTSIWTNRLHIGYFTPLNFSFGKRYLDVKGYLLQPAIGLGYTYSAQSHGLYMAPSFHIQVPFGLIEAQAHMEYTLKHGFIAYPEISVRLDALRTLLDPKLVKTGEFQTSLTTASPVGGGWYLVETKYTNNQVHIQDIGPFWGVTPRFGWAGNSWSHKPYRTVGIGLTGRLNFLGADIHVDKGKLVTGVVPNVQALNGTVKTKFDSEKVLGLVNTTEISLEGVVNIPGLVMGLIRPNALISMGMKTTPLNRFNFHLGYAYIVPGRVNYVNEAEATAYTNQFFADHPNIERNEINDPMQHKAMWGVTYGVSYEMGAVGIRVNNKLSKTSGRGTTIDFYYILPVMKIKKAYK
ncbi:MAG: hypothetical protein ACPGLV_05030 [Bacteroidia bacterium]